MDNVRLTINIQANGWYRQEIIAQLMSVRADDAVPSQRNYRGDPNGTFYGDHLQEQNEKALKSLARKSTFTCDRRISWGRRKFESKTEINRTRGTVKLAIGGTVQIIFKIRDTQLDISTL